MSSFWCPLACGSAALAVLCSVAPGRAAPDPGHEGKVSLAVEACPETFESSMRAILRIELGELLDENGSPSASNQESIGVTCEPEVARISARSADGLQEVHNDLRFDAFPGDAAPRAVALAALEALRAVDPTLATRIEDQRKKAALSEAPRPEPSARPPPPPAAPERAAPVASRRYTRLALGGVVRLFPADPRTTAAGARVELGFRFAAPWDLAFDIEGALARQSASSGAVEARLLSTGAWFGARAGSSEWSFTGGLGGRFGLAGLRGTPDEATTRGHDVTRPWAGPMLVLRGDGSADLFAFALMLEGGFAVMGAEGLADGAPALGIDGGWVAASASAGIRF